jgi:hypothetical protein
MGQLGPDTAIVGDFNTLLSSIDIPSRPKKINKETSKM